MQNMYKTNPKRKKLLKTTTFTVALFVAAIMISSTIPIIATPGNSTKMNIKYNDEPNPGLGIGNIVKNQGDFSVKSAKNAMNSLPFGETMYAYNAYDPSGQNGECAISFDVDDPGTIDYLNPTGSGDFIAGATYTCDDQWLGVEYLSGVLWEIDPDTGDMTSIGGGGQAMNGLAYDPVNNRMYGSGSDNNLYEVDPDTGITDYIGPFGGSIQYIIGMAFDGEGTLYGWDLGTDSLYTIDTDSGTATLVGSLGINLNYAQDGDFHRDTDTLYLTARDGSYVGKLYTCNKETGELTDLGQFHNNIVVTGSVFLNSCIPPEHDVGIREITKPESSGYAIPELPMQCLIKNYGANAEITDVQMEVIKCEAGPWIMEEYFDGSTFPPDGWTTDWWKQSFTNVAGGTSPEARDYYYDQYYSGGTYWYDYYDNYIQSPTINCTGIEKINLWFRWAADIYNPCSVYLKYRKNLTSPWKDVTPWTNPIDEDMVGDFYEIGCYGFGENLGEEFQFKFEYLGWYSYFRYWWLDDVHLEACGGCADYAEIVEDVSIAPGEELLIDFPPYNPPEWQNESYEDTWEEYPIHAFTLLEDQKPKNDEKWKLIDLYYPYLHDIEVSSIDSPVERSIPGQVLPVVATIKNVGQYPECCIPIDVLIGEGVVGDAILTEDMSSGVPPPGWHDEHKDYVSYYGWSTSYTSNSGGSSPEARLLWYRALAGYVMYTPVIDTSGIPALKLHFKSFIDHWSGSGLYTLHAGYSHDLVNWYATWSVAPSGNEQYDVECDIAGGSATTYVGFWLMGSPVYMDYWYLDDVEIYGIELVEEWSDNMCQGPDIEPGESVTFEFDDWTPEALGEEITTTNDYLIKSIIEMEGDANPGNDVASGKFTLEFWHDAQIEVASPAIIGREPEEWLRFDDGTNVNALGLTAGGTWQYAIRLTPDELADYSGYDITTVKRFHGYGPDFAMNGKVKIYEQGTATTPGDLITETEFSAYEGDWHDITLDEPVEIGGDEDIWVSIEVTHSSGQFPAGMDPALNYPGKGEWLNLGSSWQTMTSIGFSTDWNIAAGVEAGGAPIKVYIQPGTEDIEGLATNLGTFPEPDLTCWAEIYSFIDDPENGTLLYEDNVTNIDLDTPLGGTEAVVFDDFNFANEGLYGLFLSMPDDNDDITKNNQVAWGVAVDDTKPDTLHTLEPATPDGDNGWYVSDVEVTLDAVDPIGHEISSGVKEIKYKLNNGATQTITGNHGTFVIDIDKENIPIEYWAIDNVGNEEIHNTFTIDMDQTDPLIDMTYEWTDGPNPGSWWMIFTANATDATSKMDRVRFLLNDVEQEVVTGPGPEYVWQFLYSGGLHITITAEAYDTAGNMKYDEIIDPESINVNAYSQNLVQKTVEILGL